MSHPEWITDLFATVDSMDADGFSTFLTDDCSFIYANSEPVVGRAQIREFVAGFFGSIAGLSHRLVRTWGRGNEVVCQLEVTYTRLDNGVQVAAPSVTIFDLAADGDEQGKIAEYRIYNDLTPVYSPA